MQQLVFVIDTLSKGGAENVLLKYVEHLPDRYRIKLIVLKHIVDYRLPGNTQVEFILSAEQKLAEHSFQILHKLTEAARAADLIIGFSDFLVNYLCVLAAKLAQKPVLLAVRNQISQELERFELKAINRDLVAFAYQQADKIVCVSNACKAELVNSFGIPATKIHRLPNPCDVAAFSQPTQSPKGLEAIFSGPPVILAVGRLVKQKNLAFIVNVFAKLQSGASLCIAGKGPEYEALLHQVKQLNLTSKVHFLEHRDDIPALLQHASMLFSASLYEGQPNVVLEAMAAGTLVVAPKIPAIEELITHNINGLLFAKDNEADALKCIEMALANDEKIKALANYAGNTVKAHDVGLACRALADVIDSLPG